MIDYNLDTLRRDLIAGLTVAAISLPQGMAYALLAGVDPQYGPFSAIAALASVFGSSSHLINGSTSAISLVVFSALSIFDADQRVEVARPCSCSVQWLNRFRFSLPFFGLATGSLLLNAGFQEMCVQVSAPHQHDLRLHRQE
jgi:Sulfate permease family